jgi:cyclic pyranopterin monophosphate synthase
MNRFSHLDTTGAARMVNVGSKPQQQRQATASATLRCHPNTIRALHQRALPKGDVLVVAQIAGIQAAKRTADLVPLCHPLPLSHVAVSFHTGADRIEVQCVVETFSQTGVEMEAMTGATVAALTLYDMCKAVDKAMCIDDVRVMKKIKK